MLAVCRCWLVARCLLFAACCLYVWVQVSVRRSQLALVSQTASSMSEDDDDTQPMGCREDEPEPETTREPHNYNRNFWPNAPPGKGLDPHLLSGREEGWATDPDHWIRSQVDPSRDYYTGRRQSASDEARYQIAFVYNAVLVHLFRPAHGEPTASAPAQRARSRSRGRGSSASGAANPVVQSESKGKQPRKRAI